jgi:hypothetical protein
VGGGKRVSVLWVWVLMTLPNLYIFFLSLFYPVYIYIYVRLTLYLRDGNCFEGGTKSYIYICQNHSVAHMHFYVVNYEYDGFVQIMVTTYYIIFFLAFYFYSSH